MKLIDYALSSTSVSNPDGKMAAILHQCTVVSGPGTLPSGTYTNALDFGTQGKISTVLKNSAFSTERFCIRAIIKIDSPVTQRQNIVESNALPFAMFADAAGGSNDFKIAVSVGTTLHGWSGTTTQFFQDLKLGTWYTVDMVYDLDTLAVYINGNILSVHAFPSGAIKKFTGNQVFIGTWVDGARNHFNGQIAAIQWYDNEIPVELETQLDERRSAAEWYMSYKEEQVKPTLNFGWPKQKYFRDYSIDAWIQMYDNGLIMYSDSNGAAFEMHGAIFQLYKNLSSKSQLGYLVSDEIPTRKNGGRKSIFSKGGIYWSSQTGAVDVNGKVYLEYEQIGESSYLGWPVSSAVSISGGKEQLFQGGRMYYKNNEAKAFEVHGAILTKFLNSGGVGAWGYPVSNESNIKNNSITIGKLSDFEFATIYWSGATGAFEVHGDIRKKYKEMNGPLGQLGFPITDEGNIPGAPGAKYTCFQKGSILWFGSYSNMNVCFDFKVFLGRIDGDETEGFLMGQNDMYLRAILKENGSTIHNQRIPNSGDIGGKNIHDFNTTVNRSIRPNSPNKEVEVTFDVWESDDGAPFGGGDEHLGTYKHTLNMSNAWGLRNNNGVFNSGAFQRINSITWSVKQEVNPALLTATQKWWGVTNQSTSTITYNQYASAFRDVDSAPEDWDLTDWLEKAFYELVCKGLADGGNCFGMSVEAIYAYKHRSIFSLPLDRFNTWSGVVNEFNIKHQYQVGADAIWWFVAQFLTGNTHSPMDVFNETRNAFNRGSDPVICISQNSDFSGAPHCILPIAWNSSVSPWEISILDPNFPNDVKKLFVNPTKNEFTYNAGNNYKGAQWSGGRFHYMPYSVLNEQPRTPIWDAIMLLLSGTLLLVGSDSETVSLVDENGTDLSAFGADSIARLKNNQSIQNKFVSVKGFNAKGKKISKGIITSATKIKPTGLVTQMKGKGIIASEMFMRMEKPSSNFDLLLPGIKDVTSMMNVSFGDLASVTGSSNTFAAVRNNANLFNSLKDRSVAHILNDKKLKATLSSELLGALSGNATLASLGKNFNHLIKGKKNGEFIYAVKNKLNEFKLSSSVKTSELTTIQSKDLNTSASVVNMVANQNKTFKLEISNKLGVGNDKVDIIIDKIPAAVGKNLNLNIKPGMLGLELLTTAEKVNATVSLNAQIDGRTIKKNFGVDIEGGLRIHPSTVFSNNELKVSKIENLFGQLVSSKVVKPK